MIRFFNIVEGGSVKVELVFSQDLDPADFDVLGGNGAVMPGQRPPVVEFSVETDGNTVTLSSSPVPLWPAPVPYHVRVRRKSDDSEWIVLHGGIHVAPALAGEAPSAGYQGQYESGAGFAYSPEATPAVEKLSVSTDTSGRISFGPYGSGQGGGDVYTFADNEFTGSNKFDGTVTVGGHVLDGSGDALTLDGDAVVTAEALEAVKEDMDGKATKDELKHATTIPAVYGNGCKEGAEEESTWCKYPAYGAVSDISGGGSTAYDYMMFVAGVEGTADMPQDARVYSLQVKGIRMPGRSYRLYLAERVGSADTPLSLKTSYLVSRLGNYFVSDTYEPSESRELVDVTLYPKPGWEPTVADLANLRWAGAGSDTEVWFSGEQSGKGQPAVEYSIRFALPTMADGDIREGKTGPYLGFKQYPKITYSPIKIECGGSPGTVTGVVEEHAKSIESIETRVAALEASTGPSAPETSLPADLKLKHGHLYLLDCTGGLDLSTIEVQTYASFKLWLDCSQAGDVQFPSFWHIVDGLEPGYDGAGRYMYDAVDNGSVVLLVHVAHYYDA